MDRYLASEGWKQTADKYSIRLGKPPANSVRTVALSELYEEEACRVYIDWFRQYIDAPDRRVAASMLSKRLGYLWTAPLVKAMTFHHQHVSFEPHSTYLYHPALTDETTTRFPFLAVDDLRAEALEGSRETWRAKAVEDMFASRLTPLLRNLAAIASIPMSILWENIMVRIGPLYLRDADDAGREHEHVRADFEYLTQAAPGAVFDQRKNPFTRFTTCEHGIPAAKSERITCCFYYRMSGEYCRKCPKIDTENKSQLK
ncbi:(2Fe-2S)-binding protein [Saccharibacillus sp. CPCC 101409]|uniref:(2Fe-2S)-binding protein n=1 Tax=Saccharibacillus sp. CPCC 101409 TaxID=3058041 RepID=UPI002673F794|nr:(2Fe-2S)-binding protein [Saccharibacillus sp. CPCC 101409]MDO3412444.1 (2Fe-2S)-binding protein [Saccharibacillus sp. CPCC 101409]